MSWGDFHCEITWNEKLTPDISWPYFMLTHNGKKV